MVLNILTTIAQWEREVICERTTLALRHKTAKGERVGSIPYGMRLAADGRTLEPDPGERETITAARRLRRQGLSRRGIAAELRCEGMTARQRVHGCGGAAHAGAGSAARGAGHHREPMMAVPLAVWWGVVRRLLPT